MNSMKNYLVVWISGVVTGLVLMQRWHGTAGVIVPAVETVGEAGDGGSASTALKLSTDRQGMSAVIVAGTKADVERARKSITRTVALLRRSAEGAAPH